MAKREPKPTFDPAYVRDISESVYRHQLGAEDVLRMIEKDEDQGQKLRNRAGSYDQLTRVYLKALGFEPPAIADDVSGSTEGGRG
jgi:hypothetical protein